MTDYGFIYDASIPLADALEKLRISTKDTDKDEPSQILYKAAKVLHKDAKACMNESLTAESYVMSEEGASNLVLDTYYNFIAFLLS